MTYTQEQRTAHMAWFIKHQTQTGMLGRVRPGYVAGTYGLSKDEVKEEIRRNNELGGLGK